MATKPSAPSIIRTLVPLAVGQIVAFFVSLGVEVSEDQEMALTVVLGFLVTAAYYLLVRFLEQKFPKLGGFLGWASTPGQYARNHEVVASEAVPDEDAPKH